MRVGAYKTRGHGRDVHVRTHQRETVRGSRRSWSRIDDGDGRRGEIIEKQDVDASRGKGERNREDAATERDRRPREREGQRKREARGRRKEAVRRCTQLGLCKRSRYSRLTSIVSRAIMPLPEKEEGEIDRERGRDALVHRY